MNIGAVLYVYQGEWGLPSIDFECIRAMCLVRFTRCPVEIDTKGNPLLSGGGKLPYLQIGNAKFVGYRQIKKLLDKEGYPVDGHLKGQEKYLSSAYTNMVFTNFHGYFHYFVYGDMNNFENTRSLYAKRTPFPLNFYFPGTYKKIAKEIVNIFGGFDMDDMQSPDSLVINAKKSVVILSKKLGKKVWFFGDIFSEFDAIVYAYLSVLLKASLPNNPLQNHIKACQNLVTFITRISKDIFRNESFDSIKTNKRPGISDPMLTASERSFIESERKTKIISGVTAFVAMASFAAWKGFFQKTVNKEFYSGRGHAKAINLE